MSDMRWGFLGSARIAIDAILPALAPADAGRAVAIAARSRDRAAASAKTFGIERAYGDYQSLLDDREVDAVYIGLPNSAHAEWTRRALLAGKHVLCEKPIAVSAAELDGIAEIASRSGRLVQEALMTWSHPQWHRVREIIRSGEIGPVRAVQGRFGFMSRDAGNIRNQADLGGGGLLDLGMYLVSSSRYVVEAEPRSALTLLDRDATFGTDRLTSFLLDFPEAQGSYVCSTQMGLNQRFVVLGSRGTIEVEMPFTPPASAATVLRIASTPVESNALTARSETIPAVDQYASELRAFVAAAEGRAPPVVPFASSLANMRVLDALNASARSRAWEAVSRG